MKHIKVFEKFHDEHEFNFKDKKTKKKTIIFLVLFAMLLC